MAIINRVRITVTGVAGTPAYLTAYFAGDGTAAQVDSDAFADFIGGMASQFTQDMDFATDSTVALIESTTGSITDLVSVTPAGSSGGAVGELLPRSTQLLCQLRTGVFQGGREIRGRINLPYLTESANGPGGVPASGTISAAQTQLDELVAGVGTDQLVVWSRLSGAIPNVTHGAISPQWGVLRSRRD